ncbi:hypothetical protein CJ030_MR3G017046 [Morella rubra]|uniref:Secreted protein n=1 Tax=Morella rubra TaxID=262757 RepID=A0A6A1W4R8_9ROSI|nr:hypothetical protein CJ030_MR3G017046 [Morella rubra]
MGGGAPSTLWPFLFLSLPSTGRGGGAPPLVVAIWCSGAPLSACPLCLLGLAGGQGLAVAPCHGKVVGKAMGCHGMSVGLAGMPGMGVAGAPCLV